MRHFIFTILLLFVFNVNAQQTKDFISNTTDTIFGVVVKDPFRKLEDTGNVAVKQWMKAQTTYTENILASIPGRKLLHQKFEKIIRTSKLDDIWNILEKNENLYYLKRRSDEDFAKVYVKEKNKPERIFIDPQTLHAELGTNIRLSGLSFSPGGKYLTYSIPIRGNEMETINVIIDIATGKPINEPVFNNMMNNLIAWDPLQENTFYYEHTPQKRPDVEPVQWYNKALFYRHVIGTDALKDELVAGYNVSPGLTIDSTDMFYFEIVPNSTFIIGIIRNKVSNEKKLFVAPLKEFHGAQTPWKQITDFDDAVTDHSYSGDNLYLLTYKNAPHYKVLKLNLNNPVLQKATVIIPESTDIIKDIEHTNDALVVVSDNAGESKLLRIPDATGKVETVALPAIGQIRLQSVSPYNSSFLVSLASWTRTEESLIYDPSSNKLKDPGLQKVSPENAPANLVVEKIMVTSYDGTKIPLTIIYKKGIKRDGNNPLVLYGYGAYGITQPPSYWPENFVWYDMGGIKAMAAVRGGGEFGEEWHKAGQKATKPNTWKDFIACAEYLIKNGYTSSKKLLANGGSAGGILIGRAITERPELFNGVIINVGALDMIRFEKSVNGSGNITEFGTTAKEKEFKWLYEMSAYHHVKKGVSYPGVLLKSGVNDNRVPVWSSLKMAALLQTASAGNKPVLLKLDYNTGHGASSSTANLINDLAINHAFYFWQSGHPDFQPKTIAPPK